MRPQNLLDLGRFDRLRILNQVNFSVRSHLNTLDKVIDYFGEIDRSSIPKKDWLQCQLALVEGFTNAVRHAHKNISNDIEIPISITLFEDCLEIRIWDWGPPFDLHAYIKSISNRQPNNWSEGGRGILILHKIADRLDYLRDENNRNCLSIVKYFSPIHQSQFDERD